MACQDCALRPPAGFTTTRRHHTQTGYTLLELTTVVILLGILSASALRSGGDQADATATAAAHITAAARFARSEAVRSETPHGLTFDTTNATLSVFRLDTTDDPPTVVNDVRNPATGHLYQVDFTDVPSSHRVELALATPVYSGACTQPSALAFDATGLPRCAADLDVRLADALTITAQRGRFSTAVVVQPYSGRVAAQ